MPWIALDVLIALLSLGLLGRVLLRLWRTVKAFSRALADAGEAVARASEQLAAAQAEAPQRR